MSEFDAINTLVGWVEKLGELVRAGEEAVAARDEQAVARARERLFSYVLHSRPNSPEIRQLDNLANATRLSLFEAQVDWAIGRIAARTAEYADLRKTLLGMAADAEAAGASIRLRNVRRVIDGSSELVTSLMAVRDELAEGEDAEKLKGKIERVVKNIQDIRDALERREGLDPPAD